MWKLLAHTAAPALVQVPLQLPDLPLIKEGLGDEAEEGHVAAGAAGAVQVPHVKKVVQGSHFVASVFGLRARVA